MEVVLVLASGSRGEREESRWRRRGESGDIVLR